MDAAGRQTQDDITGTDTFGVHHSREFRHANRKTGNVVIALAIDIGHLGAFTAQQRAVGKSTPLSNPGHQLGGAFWVLSV